LYSKKNTTIRRIITGGFWVFFGKAGAALLGLAISALLSRLLKPEELGTYFLLFSLTLAASLVARCGMEKTAVRMIAESMGLGEPYRAARVVRFSLFAGVTGSALVGILLMGGGGKWLSQNVFHSVLMLNVIGISVLWILFFSLQRLVAESFRGYQEIHLATIYGGVLSSVFTAGMLGVLWFLKVRVDLFAILIIIVAAIAVNTVVAAIHLYPKISVSKEDINLKGHDVFQAAWPIWISDMAVFLLSQADLWVLGILCAADNVALYGAVLRLIVLVVMPIMIVNLVLQPFIAELNVQGRKKELEQILRGTAAITAMPALAIMFSFIFWGDDILGIIFGEYYREGQLVLTILTIGKMVQVCTGSCGIFLIMTGHQNLILKISLFTGVMTVIFLLFLVRIYGMLGCAIAASSGVVMQNLLMLFFAKRRTGIWTHMGLPYDRMLDWARKI